MIKKRSEALFIFLDVITLGIYSVVMYCIMGSEIEKICEGDGKKQMPYIGAWLLGIITLGIVPLVWRAKAMDRLQDNSYRYGTMVRPPHDGTTHILWNVLGLFIFAGPFIGDAFFVTDLNSYAGVYGNVRPLPYTANYMERENMMRRAVNAPAPYNQGMNNPVQRQMPDIDAQRRENVRIPDVQQRVNPQPPKFVDPVTPTKPAKGCYNGNKTGGIGCVKGSYEGIIFPMKNGEELIIGTDPSVSNIVLDSSHSIVSGKHCLVRYEASDDSYIVVDCSTNGTFASDGHQLMKNSPESMKKGDFIFLGDANVTFKFE